MTTTEAATGKQAAAFASVLAGAALTILKLIVGFATGSLAILSEAAHSGLDFVAAAITLGVVRIADAPPDENHPYGHARAENLGALAETLLLVVTAGWVLWKAFEHIFVAPETPRVTIWSFAVMGTSLVVDWQRSRALRRAAERYDSPALAADAAHFANDLLSTLVVLASLGFVVVAPRLGVPPWITMRVDAFAAIGVAVIALSVSWSLGRRAVRALMDDVPHDLNQRLVAEIAGVAGVTGQARVRTRFVGTRPFVDVSVQVPRQQTLEEAHRTSETVETAVQRHLIGADVVVHFEPTRSADEPHTTAVYAAAQRLGLHVHNLDVFMLQDGLRVDVDLEVPASLPLIEAHRYSEAFERIVREELPPTTRVAVHLEPRRDELQPAVRRKSVTEQVHALLDELGSEVVVHEVEVILTDGGAVITLRCGFPATLPLGEVHTRMARLESYLRRGVPDVARVLIDPEPLAL